MCVEATVAPPGEAVGIAGADIEDAPVISAVRRGASAILRSSTFEVCVRPMMTIVTYPVMTWRTSLAAAAAALPGEALSLSTCWIIPGMIEFQICAPCVTSGTLTP